LQLLGASAALSGCNGGSTAVEQSREGDDGSVETGGTGSLAAPGAPDPGPEAAPLGNGAEPSAGGASGGASSSPAAGGSNGTLPGTNGGTPALGGAGPEPLPNGEPLPLRLDDEPVRYRYVRLTHTQWENSVRDNLRLAEPTGQQETLSPDAMGTGYSNDERLLYVDSTLYFDYEAAAEALGTRLESDAALLASVSAETDPAGFIAEVGRRFYRRTLSDDEVARYLEIFDTGAAYGTNGDEFAKGASLVVEVMLQAPTFLYRVESADEGSLLSGVELATKLAYFITNTTPTDALLDAAESGSLDTSEGVAAAARALLDSPAATLSLRNFHDETLGVSRLAAIDKTGTTGWDPALNQDLLQSTQLFFDRLYSEGLGLRDLLLDRVAFVDPALAPLYDVTVKGDGFSELELGPERPGYFAQAPNLALNAAGDVPKPASRGVDLNRRVLCADVPPPPAGVDTTFPPVAASGSTNRERFDSLTAAEPCAECHKSYLNPLGFAFENFDGLGRLRDTDDGAPLDTSGEYPFTEGTLQFSGAPELMTIIAESEQAHACYGKHLAQYALARGLDETDEPLVDALASASRSDAASVQDLVLALVSSEAFRTRGVAR
jgi:hypothetical protein